MNILNVTSILFQINFIGLVKNKDSKYINFINHYSLDGHKLRKSEPSTPNKKQKSGIVSHFQKKSAQVKTKSRIGIDDIKSSAKSLFSDSETHSFRENDIMNLKSKVLRLEATIKDKDEALRTLNIEYSRMFEFKQNKNISEDK